MRSMFLGAAFLTISASAASVGALNLAGSDTLEKFTKDVLVDPACTGVSSLVYVGGGSGTGQSAMLANPPTQQVAPMSRFLNGAGAACATAPEAEGIVLGLDGVVVAANKTEGAACGNALAKNTTIGSYTFTDWKDVLKIVYFGLDHTGAKDCNSALRNSVVDNWGSLFQGGCGAGSTCAKLSHAWRRSDFSGTTDVFIGLVGGGAIPPRTGTPAVNPFCNSATTAQLGGVSDFQDQDPIRRDCTDSEQVCSTPLYNGSTLARNDKKLGLVQVVFIPETSTNDINYPSQACTFGQCKFLLTEALTLTCPNGKAQLFGKCFQPIKDLGAGAFTASCINHPDVTCFGATPGQDGRAYNLAVKKANGAYVVDNEGRPVTGAYYRVRTTTQSLSATRVMTLGATLCKEDDATVQIGCLPQQDKCSIGYAGREAISATLRPDVAAMDINSIAPSQANIEALVVPGGTVYPLARKLYFNTVKGFGAVTGEELNLASCMANKAIVDSHLTARGFIPLPTGGLLCQDNSCGAGTGCSNNAAPFPTAKQ